MNEAQTMLERAFPGIGKETAREMIDSGRQITVPPGTVLCREDEYGTTFYIILEGQVKASKTINEVEERLLTTLKAGDFFGEMALIHNAPRAATITAITHTRLLEITKDAFNSLLERSSSISLAIIRAVSRRLRENDQMAIDDLRIKAAELANTYQQLAEQEYARSAFLSAVAHELRTPLTTVNGFLQLIHKGSLTAGALQNALEAMTRNVQEIISLVNDILFLQEMEIILPDLQAVDLAILVKAQIDLLKGRAAQNNVQLKLEAPVRLPQVQADARSLGRAIAALIDNAIKFSPEGGNVMITVGCAATKQWVIIQDHGLGIPYDAQPHIFDRYFRLDQMGGYIFRGLGLGLSIAKQAVEAHKGHITMDSEPGKGSRFTIWMPVD